MPEAARIGDQVSHTSAFAGLIVGALAGAVIGAAIVATGGAAALAIAGAACTGASLGGMLGELVGSMIPAVGGPIITGALTVYIGGDGRQAAIACRSTVACIIHKVSLVAQGSETVLIEGMHAARKTDKGVCSFVIAQGCSTVLIGGPVHTCAAIHSEVPWQAELALLVLGLAGGGLAMAAKGLGMAAIAARLGGGLLGGVGGGIGGHWLGGKVFGEGSTGQKVFTFAGGFLGSILGGGIAGKIVPGEPVPLPNEKIPLGFNNREQYNQSMQELNQALEKSGVSDAKIGVRGSSMTGTSKDGGPFRWQSENGRPASDIDVFAESDQLTQGMSTSKNQPGFVHPDKIMRQYPEIKSWSEKWTDELGRDITLGGWKPGTLPPGSN